MADSSAIALPLINGAGSVIAGLINGSASQPTPDLSALFATIAQSGQQEQQLINQLPTNLQPLYASQNQAGSTLQNTTTGIGNNLLTSTQNLYGPNNPAVTGTLQALKQQDYSTLPGTVNALKSNLAATGGLERGGAARAITQATLAPAAQYSGQAATVQGQQLQAQQANVQSALNKIAAMDDATANSLFGMSVAQATQILQSGRSDLQTQLSQLINSINTTTNQQLNVEGVAANAGYQNQVASNANNAAIVNGLTGLGSTAAGDLYSALAAPASTGVGFTPGVDSTPTGDNANPANYGIIAQ